MKLFALAFLIALALLSVCRPSAPAASPPGAANTSAAATPPVQVTSSATPKNPRMIDFNVKRIRLGTAYNDVIKELGRPAKSRKIKIDMCGEETHQILDYHGLKFDLTAHVESGVFGVGEIEVTSSKWLVEPGILVGSGMEEVRRKLGDPWGDHEEDGFSILTYITSSNDLAHLYFLKSKLVKVRLWINPC